MRCLAPKGTNIVSFGTHLWAKGRLSMLQGLHVGTLSKTLPFWEALTSPGAVGRAGPSCAQVGDSMVAPAWHTDLGRESCSAPIYR